MNRISDSNEIAVRTARVSERILASSEIQKYLLNSLIVGLATGVIATVAGTMAALGLQRTPKWFRLPFDGLTYISIIVPELVIALATLVFFASTIGRDGVITDATGVELGFGYDAVVTTGGTPLSVLEGVIDRYVAGAKKA